MKKLLVLLSAVALMGAAFAAAPQCSIEQEFWGHKYIKLIDVNGVEYKLSVPAEGSSTKYTTKTGWYLITWEGKIKQYQDKVVLQKK